jgi:hypothetical protein
VHAVESRGRALALRGAGWSVNDIAREIGVAKSTAWLWVRHLPLDPNSERAARKRAHARTMSDSRWERHRRERDAAREGALAAAASEVGELTDRDVLLLGAAVYWCEGAKSKPWRRMEAIQFTNSDAGLVGLFLRFLRVAGVAGEAVSFRVSIHETADATAAVEWWARQLDLDHGRFHPSSIKRHRPSTNRHNLGADYHGCLVVYVRGGRQLYWRVEGIMRAINGNAG